MAWSFPLGRLFGSEVRVHVTFFLLLLWVGWVASAQAGLGAAINAVLFVIAVFACVVAHEYGHALMARRYGIATRDITLLPIGGLARLERMPERPGAEIAVALAGPAVNVVIWAFLAGVLGARASVEDLADIGAGGEAFLARLAFINLFLAVFNMIPAFPMDGGRVARALLTLWLGRLRATRIAATLGQVLAVGLGALGFVTGSPVLLLIGVFIFLAAAAERGEAGLSAAVRDAPLQAAMITRFEALGLDATLGDATAALMRTTQHEFPVCDGAGRLQGFLTRRSLYRALAEGHDGSFPVADVMSTGIPVLRPSDPLEQAVAALREAEVPALGAVDRAGRLVGYLTPENLGEYIVVASAPGLASGRRGR